LCDRPGLPVMSMAEPRAGIDLSSIDFAVPPQQDF
jgi:hypothetical protein